LWVLGYEAGIYKTGNCLKSLPDWYWFHQVGIASSPYQTGTGFIRLVLPQVPTKLVLVSSGWYCLKSLPNWYWFLQVGIASSPYQTGTGFISLVLPQVPTKLVLVSDTSLKKVKVPA